MEGVSVIIPAYNEDVGLADVLKRVQTVFEGVRPYEIIVINDGSTDATATIAAGAGVGVITNPCNSGYGFSLKRGMREAQYECMVIVDADGTYPIEKIPDLLKAYDEGFDMVVGARQGKEYYSSFGKRIARYFFKWMSEFVVGQRIPDINSGLRVIRRSKILSHLNDLSNAFSFTTSTTLIFFLQHYFVAYIPITYHLRQGRTKVRYVRDALRTLQIMVEITGAYNPIKLFLLLALVPVCYMIVVGIYAIVWAKLWYFIFALPAFFFALFLLSVGFLASMFRKKI